MAGRERPDSKVALWVGCYTADMGGEGEGIVALGRDGDGDYVPLGPATAVDSPSFLALHPSQPVLYAVNERAEAGTVMAFRYDADGGLSALGPAMPAGSYACHAAVDPDGKLLVISCWGDGSVVLCELEPDGSLGLRHVGVSSVDPYGEARQSRAHACLFFEDGQFVTSDLGHDALRFWRFSGDRGLEPTGTLTLPHGSGPRHFARGSAGIVYVVTEYSAEVAMLSPVTSRTGEPRLELAGMSPATLTGARRDDAAAEICLDSNGQHLYVAVRGSNRICTMRIGSDGTPSPLREEDSGGDWPRHHCVDGSRLVVALERSSALAIFEPTGEAGLGQPSQLLRTGSPSCVLPHR